MPKFLNLIIEVKERLNLFLDSFKISMSLTLFLHILLQCYQIVGQYKDL